MITKKYIIINASTSQNNSKCKKQRPIILIKWRYDIIGKKPNNNCSHHFQNHSPCSWYFIGDCNSNRFVCCNWDLKNYEIFYVGIFFGLNIMLIFFTITPQKAIANVVGFCWNWSNASTISSRWPLVVL